MQLSAKRCLKICFFAITLNPMLWVKKKGKKKASLRFCCIYLINDSLWSKSSASSPFFFSSHRGSDFISQYFKSWQLSGSDEKEEGVYLKERKNGGEEFKVRLKMTGKAWDSCLNCCLIFSRYWCAEVNDNF